MGKFIDITGQKFNRLTAIKRVGTDKYKNALWLCKCDCGNEKVVKSTELRNSKVKSCGCINREKTIKRNLKHNLSNHRLYRIYHAMINRCNNSKMQLYYCYGGRGIKVCDEWLNDFMNFYTWAINNGYQDNLSIDRIDVNGNYEPNNCRWATNTQQVRNMRTNKLITYKNETHCISEWSEITGIPFGALRARLSRGWDTEKALTMGVRQW